MKCYAAPYEGNKDNIFFSYCHKDAARVYPIIERLALEGFRVWYDDGIHPGDDWPDVIATHLENSAVVIASISGASIESHNCRNEVTFAVARNKPFVSVLIENTQMPRGIQIQLKNSELLRYYEMSPDEFYAKLISSPTAAKCREPNARASASDLALWQQHAAEYARPDEKKPEKKGADPILNLKKKPAREEENSETVIDDEKRKREEIERRKREEAERLKREEIERRQREEAERLKREEIERRQREEAERLKREEIERRQREEAERLKREEIERRQREEAERLKREEIERRQREEAERLKSEEETALRVREERQARVDAERRAAERARAAKMADMENAQEDDPTVTEEDEPTVIGGDDPTLIDEDEPTVRDTGFDDDDKTVRDGWQDEDDDKTVREDRPRREVLLDAVLCRKRTGEVFSFKRAGTVIGRKAGDCDLVLEGSREISRRHARIDQKDRVFTLCDLGSSFGTSVNGTPLEGEEPVVLNSVSLIELSGEPLLFLSGPDCEAAALDAVGWLQSRRTGELRLVTNDPMPLDRHHQWEGGVLGDNRISRTGQTEIVYEDGTFYIRDLDSPNGTFRNGRKVTGTVELSDGDEISVVDEKFSFSKITFDKRSTL